MTSFNDPLAGVLGGGQSRLNVGQPQGQNGQGGMGQRPMNLRDQAMNRLRGNQGGQGEPQVAMTQPVSSPQNNMAANGWQDFMQQAQAGEQALQAQQQQWMQQAQALQQQMATQQMQQPIQQAQPTYGGGGGYAAVQAMTEHPGADFELQQAMLRMAQNAAYTSGLH